MTPLECIQDSIQHWEGGLSLETADRGNYVNGVLVGSKYGVTAPALASHRKVPVSSITKDVMAALTMQEAAQIGVDSFYHTCGIDSLAWNRVTASVMDFSWGSGPGRAARFLQKMVGVTQDGQIGPATDAAFNTFCAQYGEDGAAREWGAVRDGWYDTIVANDATQGRFLNGWKNRANSFLPGTPWWGRW